VVVAEEVEAESSLHQPAEEVEAELFLLQLAEEVVAESSLHQLAAVAEAGQWSHGVQAVSQTIRVIMDRKLLLVPQDGVRIIAHVVVHRVGVSPYVLSANLLVVRVVPRVKHHLVVKV
jgi:hypothetical protein